MNRGSGALTPRVILRLIGVPDWNLERGPISNEEEGGKHIYDGIFWDLEPLNGVAPGFSPVRPPL